MKRLLLLFLVLPVLGLAQVILPGAPVSLSAVPVTSAPPSGAAGGVLGGTYPNPTFGSFTSADLRTALTDESGTGAALFAGGNIGAATGTSLNLSSGIIGTTTNDNAAAGFVGEYVTAQRTLASVQALTSGASINVTSISLTAGDWDVGGVCGFIPANTTVVGTFQYGVSTTTGTLPSVDSGALGVLGVVFTSNGAGTLLTVPYQRLSLSATTTVFLVQQATFGTSTCTGYGTIWARRRR